MKTRERIKAFYARHKAQAIFDTLAELMPEFSEELRQKFNQGKDSYAQIKKVYFVKKSSK